MKSPLRMLIFRLLGNQLMMVFSAIMIRALMLAFLPNHVFLCSAVAVIILAVCLLGQYQIAWKFGERDRNLVKYNHITYAPGKGFIAGLISCAPTVAALAALVFATQMTIYIVLIAGTALTSPLTGLGYLHGHKLKSYGISIVYRKKR